MLICTKVVGQIVSKNEVKSFVELQGEPRELKVWLEQFPPQGDPSVVTVVVLQGNGETRELTGISCSAFAQASVAKEVHLAAKELFAEMKGWVMITTSGWSGHNPESHVGAVYTLGEDGEYHAHHFIELPSIVFPVFSAGGEGAVTRADGSVRTDTPKPTQGQEVLRGTDEALKAMLRYISQVKGEDWNQLYRAYDAIGRVPGLRAAGILRRDAVRLAQTFSVHRKHYPLPFEGKAMPFLEARSLILRAIKGRAFKITPPED